MSIFNQPWRERALCAQIGPELFFPDNNVVPREAKKICASCEVTTECLTYAIQNYEQEGVWGGTSPRERTHIRKRGTSNG